MNPAERAGTLARRKQSADYKRHRAIFLNFPSSHGRLFFANKGKMIFTYLQDIGKSAPKISTS
ncbi:hypothetical protein [Hahella sp. HN01]|uniref:hypothetical protein n=1 Tax=Hahella sp. HN01 TaxID=2847262 RepID=UPI001C1EA3DE|nr:hypothetical protein [Hahella sp. HN01]MBU6955094.1 hypothetical protein [Hahella sp. HN01]